MRRVVPALAAVGLVVLAPPAHAQTATNDFGYSPEAQERGKAITITGRCIDSEELAVTVQEGASGDGGFVFSKSFPSETGAKIAGSITVPDDAPFGPYVITGTCRTGPTSDFSKNGPFAVVEKVGATTSTTTSGSTTTTSSTTSTTAAEGVTTTTTDVTELPSSVESSNDDSGTTTTVDEFAGTRNDDDDSIGPLLILIGVVPLALAVGAIAVAMRRRGAAPSADA